jgi:DNA-binding XRE family transcriptional regulator
MSEPLRALVARRLRQYRASLGLTQPELAKRLKVSRNTVIEWEKEDGRSQPSWEQWEKMCSWTGISPQWFVTDDSFNSEVVDFAVRVQALPDRIREGLYALLQYQYQEKGKTKSPV